MKEQILKLRSEGKTYDQIVEIVGCSKSTVSYHCGKGQKEKTLKRQRKHRKTLKAKLTNKINGFCRNKVRNFKRGKPDERTNSSINYSEAFEKLVNSPKCYLTGIAINLEDIYSYQLDHIIPQSKGGSNNIENMGLALSEANKAKSDMLLEEFIDLCKLVLINQGYKIIAE